MKDDEAGVGIPKLKHLGREGGREGGREEGVRIRRIRRGRGGK